MSPFTDLMITPAVAKVLSSGVVVATFSLPRDPHVSDAEWLRLASAMGPDGAEFVRVVQAALGAI